MNVKVFAGAGGLEQDRQKLCLEDGLPCPPCLGCSQCIFPLDLMPGTEVFDLVCLFVSREIICSVEDIMSP